MVLKRTGFVCALRERQWRLVSVKQVQEAKEEGTVHISLAFKIQTAISISSSVYNTVSAGYFKVVTNASQERLKA